MDPHDDRALTAAQEELRRERQRADALAAKLQETLCDINALMRAVSHDLRAPLRAIQGFAQIAIEECGAALPDEGRDHLRRVSMSARRMSELIDGLAGLSKIDAAQMHRTVFDLGALTRAIWQRLEHADAAAGRVIRFTVDDGLEVNGDRRLLRIAIEHLLSNARKFTAGTATPAVTVGRRQIDGEMACFVADNGVGFNPAYTNRLFAPFQRLHPESEFPGRGVGLAAVHRVIRRHGGRVWAEGAVACGATVLFTLPAASDDVR